MPLGDAVWFLPFLLMLAVLVANAYTQEAVRLYLGRLHVLCEEQCLLSTATSGSGVCVGAT